MSSRSPHESDAHAGSGAELDALLQPSLARAEHAALYSVRANFLVAFFGGVYATLIFSSLNSRRLGRARTDAALYLGIAAAWTATVAWCGYLLASGQWPDWLLLTGSAGRDARHIGRAVSLAVFGLLYLRLRPFYTAAQLGGRQAPSPWKAGLLAVAASAALTWLIGALGASLGVAITS
jgi:hypothetical protein